MRRAETGLLPVRVQPRARRDEVLGWRGDALAVRVTAAPDGGAANRAVIGLLAEAFDVSRTAVVLVRGATSRDKLFKIGGQSVVALRARLGAEARP